MNAVVEGELLDGPAIANTLAPTNRDTFDSYACDEFTRFLSHRLADVKRIDVLWDRYLEESVKQTTCINRGSGIRLKVTGHDRLPNDWKSFLQCDKNKKSCFFCLQILRLQMFGVTVFWLQPAAKKCYAIVILT